MGSSGSLCRQEKKQPVIAWKLTENSHYFISVQIIIKNRKDNRISKRKRARENGRETLFKGINQRNRIEIVNKTKQVGLRMKKIFLLLLTFLYLP